MKTWMYYRDFCQKSNKHAPNIGRFSREQFFKLRNIYSLKSHKPFINRSFDTYIGWFTSFFVKIMPKTPVLKPKIQRVHRAAILNFGKSTRCFVLFITQVNHVISNFRMMQSCIVSMQVTTWAVIVVYRQNIQAQITAKSSHQRNEGGVKTWHQGVKGVKVQGKNS